MFWIAHGIRNQTDAKIAEKKGYNLLEVDVAKRIIFTKFTIAHGAIPGKLGFGPTLEHLLTSKYKNKLFLDIKHANYSLRFTSRICKLLELSKIKNAKICGTDWKVISNISAISGSFPFYTLRDKNDWNKIQKILPHIYSPRGFSIKHDLVDKNFVKNLKSKYPKSKIYTWTVDHEKEIARLTKLKIDGIITNNWRN